MKFYRPLWSSSGWKLMSFLTCHSASPAGQKLVSSSCPALQFIAGYLYSLWAKSHQILHAKMLRAAIVNCSMRKILRYTLGMLTEDDFRLEINNHNIFPQFMKHFSLQLTLMRSVRQSIVEGRFPEFIQTFMKRLFPSHDQYPSWAVDALASVNITLE